jgi:hypothetical protein
VEGSLHENFFLHRRRVSLHNSRIAVSRFLRCA